MYVTANGLRVHYHIEGQGPVVLFLHPVGLDLTWWESQVEALRSEFQVLRLDFRGHGESGIASPPYTLVDFANDAHALLEELKLAPAHVVGLSVGGIVAQLLALVQTPPERCFTPAFLDSPLVAQCRRRLLANDVGAWAATWRAIAELDTLPQLSEIRAPTLVTTGDADVSTPVPAAQVIADHIPGAILKVMPGAPHMAPYERPDLFNPLVLEFLRSVAS